MALSRLKVSTSYFLLLWLRRQGFNNR
jgi:hypothetical protein